MNIALGPFAIAALMLIVGGAAKTARPSDTATALRIMGIPVPALVVRIGGLLELGVGAWALSTSDRLPGALLALSYSAFVVFVAAAMSRGAPISSCGCFGRVDTRPSVVHLVINSVAVGAGVAVTIDPGAGFRRVVEAQPMSGIPFVALVVVGTALAMVALTALPRALDSMSEADG